MIKTSLCMQYVSAGEKIQQKQKLSAGHPFVYSFNILVQITMEYLFIINWSESMVFE